MESSTEPLSSLSDGGAVACKKQQQQQQQQQESCTTKLITKTWIMAPLSNTNHQKMLESIFQIPSTMLQRVSASGFDSLVLSALKCMSIYNIHTIIYFYILLYVHDLVCMYLLFLLSVLMIVPVDPLKGSSASELLSLPFFSS